CNRPDGLGSCDIYVARREGDRWSSPHNLGTPINSSGWEAQPSLAADGRTLYFVSNRPGGQGGYDLWRSALREDGRWDTPENLGPAINTPYDERSEEHTSELQSRENLVCRLLLEKKKNN